MDTLTIIMPAYNEAARLPRTFDLIKHSISKGIFDSMELKEIFVVDDGSKDQTIEITEQFASSLPQLRLIKIYPNQGKGNAIHEGLKAATSDWCLIADADSATPWDQFLKLLKAQTPIAIASRDLPESDVRVQQSWVREHMGKTFNLIVRMITQLPYRDTQCGFKLIKRKSIQPFLSLLEVKRFAWDVELLMFARAYAIPITEVAVAWEHQDASRVNAIKDSFEMLMRVIQMRIRICLLQKKK